MKEDTIRNSVLFHLKEYPELRDDDKMLILKVLSDLGYFIEGDEYFLIKKEKVSEMPSFETIRRIRQHIQSPKGENLYHPSKEIDEKREKAQSNFRSRFSKREKTAYEYPNSQFDW